MNDISTLPKTTFSGRRFTRKQLEQVQETVQTFKNLSLKELALTVCEHLNWTTPNGKLKVNSALTLLEKLEFYGIVTLPAKRKPNHRFDVYLLSLSIRKRLLSTIRLTLLVLSHCNG